MANQREDVPDVAFYYPGHLWHHGDWIKTLLLFFDGVGLLLPEYKQGEPEVPGPDRAATLSDRHETLDDLENDLRRAARRAWKRPASFALGLAGASWTYATGDPIGAILAAGALALGGSGSPPKEAGAFSYLFAAHERYA